MEREPISKKDQLRDSFLIGLSGGIIGILGAISEIRILTFTNPSQDVVIWVGGASILGLGLGITGATRFIELRKSSKISKEI